MQSGTKRSVAVGTGGLALVAAISLLWPKSEPTITLAWDDTFSQPEREVYAYTWETIVESAPTPHGPWTVVDTLPFGMGTATFPRTNSQGFFRVGWHLKGSK